MLERDIILIIGQNSVGKTTACNLMRDDMAISGVKVAPTQIKDTTYCLKLLEEDDLRGGYGHHHDWCAPNSPKVRGGHSHAGHSNILPFMITTQEIVDGLFFDFFSALSTLPRDNKLYFAELTGGRNGNPGCEPQASIDMSLARIHDLLYGGVLPDDWLKRVLAVVHPYAHHRQRFLSNAKRELYHHTSHVTATTSSKKTHTTLDVFREDDFNVLRVLFREHGAPHIYSVENNFDATYAERLNSIGKELAGMIRATSRSKGTKRDIILVMGQSSAGKPRILAELKHSARLKKVVLEDEVISDLPILANLVQDDDQKGGLRHYHSWCDGATAGHKHEPGSSDSDFIVFSNELIDAMHKEFFDRLSTLPETGKLWLAELSGGENTNPFSDPAYAADFSFRRLAASLAEGLLPAAWLDRILTIVHPVVTSKEVRPYENDIEYIYALAKDRQAVRRRRSDAVMKMFGIDDFDYMEPLLRRHHIPHIYHVRHDSADLFALRLKKITGGLLQTYKIVRGRDQRTMKIQSS